MRFWDTSALVPLLVRESTSDTARAWMTDDDRVAAWTLTPVEALAVIRRLVREAALTEHDAARAEATLQEMARRLHLVVDVDGAKRVAARLLRVHPLRAADGRQLAAAVLWAANRPEGRILHTFDTRLGAAAVREGFTVIPPPS